MFHPKWPDPAVIDPERVAFDFWADVDTLFINFSGEARPAVGVPLDLDDGEIGYRYLLVDPMTEEVSGLQIEDFFTYAGRRHPYLLDALDLAVVHDITPGEIAERWRQMAPQTRKSATVTAIFDELAAASATRTQGHA